MHLLLVEDNNGDVRMMREALRGFDPPVTLSVASDGHAALDFLRRCASYTAAPCPDLMLLDLNLPRKHGYEVLRELRAHPALRVLPVVIFTSTQAPQEVRRCYELGANAVVTKPLGWQPYRAAVRACVAFWAACTLSPPAGEG